MIQLRPARMNDADMLLEWRNDETTRLNFRSTALLERSGHIAWLTKVLGGDTGIVICMAEVHGSAVGTINSHECDGYQELSYTITPAWRGKGLAIPMVRQFVKEYLPGKKIQCEIKKGNVSSEKVAQALGLCAKFEKPSTDADDPRPLVVWR